ncbi:hypothetical protein EX30DRAFT_270354 [Ascodesmis nigricans]|uniref:Uncharacterized protein n=1 Tax=Ascodesmis nigricans TaxID=341454 RepID=A0A4S2MXC6_9PEZI|nr:hypothetical protein EX30DRAFT_270354 [Ascodesmis nigricans]
MKTGSVTTTAKAAAPPPSPGAWIFSVHAARKPLDTKIFYLRRHSFACAAAAVSLHSQPASILSLPSPLLLCLSSLQSACCCAPAPRATTTTTHTPQQRPQPLTHSSSPLP